MFSQSCGSANFPPTHSIGYVALLFCNQSCYAVYNLRCSLFFIWHFEIGFRIKTNRLAEKSNLFLADPHTRDYSCISDVFPLFLWKFVGQSMKIFSTIICLRCFHFYLVGKEWWLRLARFIKYVEKYKATETACLHENSFKELQNVYSSFTCCEECFLLSLLPTQKYFFLDETEHQQTDIHGLLWWKYTSTCSCHSCKTKVSRICSCCI